LAAQACTIPSVTVSAYVAAAIPDRVITVTVVVVGAPPPATLIIVLLIVGRMGAATAADANAAAVYNVKHSTARVGAIR